MSITTRISYTADGVSNIYTVPFNYLSRSHVFMKINGVVAEFNWLTAYTVQTTTTCVAGTVIEIYRKTPYGEQFVEWADGTVLFSADLNAQALQTLFVLQETMHDVKNATISINPTVPAFSSDASRLSVIPAQGEQIMTEDELKLYLGDGNKAGGFTVNADNTIAVWSDQTDATKKLSLAWWIAYFNGNEATIRIPRGMHEVLYDMTIPENICLKFDKGASLKVSDTKTLTINGAIEAGLWQIFREGTVTIGTKVKEVYPQWFGAKGDNLSDDTIAIQSCFDSMVSGGCIFFPQGEYKVARTLGVNDCWGVNLKNSNVKIAGHNAVIKRYNNDISTNALAYPVLFIGTPDNDAALATENITIENITFEGNDTRHNAPGNTPSDFRYAIEFKNTKNTLVKNCVFTVIDSIAIHYQQPVSYVYRISKFYNTTKNYDSKIVDCKFYAIPHEVFGRALIHAISLGGIDNCVVDGCYFEWCDDAIAGAGTYQDMTNVADSTYTPSQAAWTLGVVKRSGRNWKIINNTCINSSEHALYLAGCNVIVHNNSIISEDTNCNGDIKIRSQNAIVKNNNIRCKESCIGISEGSRDVLVEGNICLSEGTFSGGVIGLSTMELVTYIDNRAYLDGYFMMENIRIINNTISLPDTAPTDPVNHLHYGIRVYTPSSNITQYPTGTVRNIIIQGNTFKSCVVAIALYGAIGLNVDITGNSIFGKPFTTSSFSTITEMGSKAVVLINRNVLGNQTFRNNYIYGVEAVFAYVTGETGANTANLPSIITTNLFQYIKYFKTEEYKPIVLGIIFTGNRANYLLDRNFGAASNTAIQNSLFASDANSQKTGCFEYVAASGLRFYYNDAGGFILIPNPA